MDRQTTGVFLGLALGANRRRAVPRRRRADGPPVGGCWTLQSAVARAVEPAQLSWAGGDAADLPGSWRWRLLFDYYYLITHSSRFRGLESSFRVWGQSVNHTCTRTHCVRGCGTGWAGLLPLSGAHSVQADSSESREGSPLRRAGTRRRGGRTLSRASDTPTESYGRLPPRPAPVCSALSLPCHFRGGFLITARFRTAILPCCM